MGTTTPGLALYKPTVGERDWGEEVDANFDAIDAAIGFSVQSFGAVGDGVTDDTSAIQNALDAAGGAGGGVVLMPRGSYRITSTLTITTPGTALVGAGNGGAPKVAAVNPQYEPVTELVWDGNTTDPMLRVTFVNGLRLEGFSLNGDDNCAIGVLLEGVLGATVRDISWRFFGVLNSGPGVRGTALKVDAYDTPTDTIAGFNAFERLFLFAATSIHLAGDSGTGNDATVSRWASIFCLHGSDSNTHGIYFELADGHRFEYLFCYRYFGTGYGIYFTGDSRTNVIAHCTAGQGGVYAETMPNDWWWNLIWPISMGDGAGAIVTESGSNLYWLELGAEDNANASTSNVVNLPYISQNDQARREVQAIKGETWPRQLGTGGNQPAAGSLYLSAIGLTKGDVVTNLLCVIDGAGSGTSLSKLALYDSSFNKLAATADQGSSWNSVGSKTIPLTAPYTVTETDIYYIAVLVNASVTIPYLWRVVPNSANAPTPFSGGSGYLWVFDSSSGRTDFPSSFGGSASLGSGPCFWFGWS